MLLRQHHKSSNTKTHKILRGGQNQIRERVHTWLRRQMTEVFLPAGYPDTVTDDYWDYQKWDTLQALCSSINNTLATQAVLETAGVGKADATVLAATLQWIIRDGTGMIGRILFAKLQGHTLDCYAKQYRLFADILDDCARTVQVCTPFCHASLRLALLCVASLGFSIVGVAGGSTRASLTQHQAKADNMADVSAKDSSQETAVNLIALVLSLALVSLLDHTHTSAIPFLLFVFCSFLHIKCNYNACRSIHLPTLNPRRYQLLVRDFLSSELYSHVDLRTPSQIASDEDLLIFPWPSTQDLSIFRPFARTPIRTFVVRVGEEVSSLHTSHVTEQISIFHQENYAITITREVGWLGDTRIVVDVLLSNHSSTTDELKALFHATLLRVSCDTINQSTVWLRPLHIIHTKLSEIVSASDPMPLAKEVLQISHNFVCTQFEVFIRSMEEKCWVTSRHHCLIGQWTSEWSSHWSR